MHPNQTQVQQKLSRLIDALSQSVVDGHPESQFLKDIILGSKKDDDPKKILDKIIARLLKNIATERKNIKITSVLNQKNIAENLNMRVIFKTQGNPIQLSIETQVLENERRIWQSHHELTKIPPNSITSYLSSNLNHDKDDIEKAVEFCCALLNPSQTFLNCIVEMAKGESHKKTINRLFDYILRELKIQSAQLMETKQHIAVKTVQELQLNIKKSITDEKSYAELRQELKSISECAHQYSHLIVYGLTLLVVKLTETNTSWLQISSKCFNKQSAIILAKQLFAHNAPSSNVSAPTLQLEELLLYAQTTSQNTPIITLVDQSHNKPTKIHQKKHSLKLTADTPESTLFLCRLIVAKLLQDHHYKINNYDEDFSIHDRENGYSLSIQPCVEKTACTLNYSIKITTPNDEELQLTNFSFDEKKQYRMTKQHIFESLASLRQHNKEKAASFDEKFKKLLNSESSLPNDYSALLKLHLTILDEIAEEDLKSLIDSEKDSKKSKKKNKKSKPVSRTRGAINISEIHPPTYATGNTETKSHTPTNTEKTQKKKKSENVIKTTSFERYLKATNKKRTLRSHFIAWNNYSTRQQLLKHKEHANSLDEELDSSKLDTKHLEKCVQFFLAQKINKPILKDYLLKWKILTNKSILIKYERGINRLKQDRDRAEKNSKASLKTSKMSKRALYFLSKKNRKEIKKHKQQIAFLTWKNRITEVKMQKECDQTKSSCDDLIMRYSYGIKELSEENKTLKNANNALLSTSNNLMYQNAVFSDTIYKLRTNQQNP